MSQQWAGTEKIQPRAAPDGGLIWSRGDGGECGLGGPGGEIGGDGGFEVEGLAGDGMFEGEAPGVEHESIRQAGVF